AYFAHRGLHDNKSEAPENSMAAFKKAVDAGYGIELDVHITKDLIPVVFHDDTLNRVCGVEGKISDFTLEELEQFRLFETDEKIPLFKDVLELVDGKVPLIVEIKANDNDLRVCPKADELLKDYKGLYCMESFNPLAVKWYKKNRNEIVRGQLSDSYMHAENKKYHTPLYFAMEYLMLNFLAKPDFIAYNHKFYKNGARRINRYFYNAMSAAWTIRSQEELDARLNDFDVYIFEGFIPKQCPPKNA
ncbi:MAG: glycerophosphodiester phosphodiesterase, partial [Lachnospiraceae bacterium]|nr:glycerophosphodiester phosphodiesterase [Lachnospiraceae bacterium]